MNEQVLILAAGLALAYAIFSRLASRSVVTPPMVFMGVGLLCSPLGLGVIEIQIDNEARSRRGGGRRTAPRRPG